MSAHRPLHQSPLDGDEWRRIAANYDQERDAHSLPAALVDDLVVDLAGVDRSSVVLDHGAGTGTLAARLAPHAGRVLCYEPGPEMRRRLETRAETLESVSVVSDPSTLADESVDVVLSVNVLDHVPDVAPVLALFRRVSRPTGRVLVVLPHPLKDLGHWVRRRDDGGEWVYDHYLLQDYLREGLCAKSREDRHGNRVVTDFVSHHRRLSTYHRWLRDAGFSIDDLLEPEPPASLARSHPILYQQCSRIPYFVVLACSPG